MRVEEERISLRLCYFLVEHLFLLQHVLCRGRERRGGRGESFEVNNFEMHEDFYK